MLPSVRWALGVAGVFCVCWLCGPLPAGQDEKRPIQGAESKKEASTREKQFQRLVKLLDTPIDLKEFLQEEMSLKFALERLHSILW